MKSALKQHAARAHYARPASPHSWQLRPPSFHSPHAHLPSSTARRALLVTGHHAEGVPHDILPPLAHNHGAVQAAGSGRMQAQVAVQQFTCHVLNSSTATCCVLASELYIPCACPHASHSPVADALQRLGAVHRHAQLVSQPPKLDLVGCQHRVGVTWKEAPAEWASRRLSSPAWLGAACTIHRCRN